jgi:hypothetical protein
LLSDLRKILRANFGDRLGKTILGFWYFDESVLAWLAGLDMRKDALELQVGKISA